MEWNYLVGIANEENIKNYILLTSNQTIFQRWKNNEVPLGRTSDSKKVLRIAFVQNKYPINNLCFKLK